METLNGRDEEKLCDDHLNGITAMTFASHGSISQRIQLTNLTSFSLRRCDVHAHCTALIAPHIFNCWRFWVFVCGFFFLFFVVFCVAQFPSLFFSCHFRSALLFLFFLFLIRCFFRFWSQNCWMTTFWVSSSVVAWAMQASATSIITRLSDFQCQMRKASTNNQLV